MTQDPSLGFQLTLAARLYRTRLARALGEIGLFPGQEQVLRTLGQSPEGLAMGDLARALHVQPPTLTKTIQRLQSQALILRLARPGDGRIVHLTLTPAGRERLQAVQSAEAALEEEMTTLFRSKTEKRLRKALRKLTRHLGGPAGDGEEDEAEPEDEA